MDFNKTDLVVLIIMDGWGLAPEGPGNAVKLAKTPNLDRFWHSFPHTQLEASGEAVGLPKGVDGNSETGHLNLGAGKIVYQDLAKINKSISDGSFFVNDAFLKAISYAKKNKSDLHLTGLVGRGGVHSENNHLYSLLKICKEQKFFNVFLHLFTDGRDSPPKSAEKYVKQVQEQTASLGVGKIATLMGRYWSMDRDTRWTRTAKAYVTMTEGKGLKFFDPLQAVAHGYDEGITDEFIQPSVIVKPDFKPIGIIKDKDAVIFYNFRIDRPKQLTKAFVLKDFRKDALKTSYSNSTGTQETPFVRKVYLPDLFFVTMTEYEKNLPVSAVAFPPEKIDMPLARVLSENDRSQVHISETEKERFVTYYFDGMKEQPYPAEDWIIIPSPKVATYDLKPEMSAREITAATMEKIGSDFYNFVLVNFANPDMVGHTGNLPACVKAVETVDECVGKIVDTVLAMGKITIITADHGNAEELTSSEGGTSTKHSSNPVPFIFVAKDYFPGLQLRKGVLANVAPTVLKALGLKKPYQMTEESLI